MSNRREVLAFAAVLALLVAAFLADALRPGFLLSPADVVYAMGGFEDLRGPLYEPANRLLIDPVLQFQPWLEFSREAIRHGRLPLWNGLAGCGAPHLANGQSAVFDPFHAIAYIGRLPDAYAWMAAARLWVAGLGMFLLARRWGLGGWGRWFAGLAFPFCGFLVVWLQYPVTSVAVWMPWAFLATDRVLDRPDARSAGLLALVVGCLLLAGHVQTSAHVLLAIGAYALWRHRTAWPGQAPLGGWAAGVVLGLALAAIEIVPLACYLSRSPVWTDRDAERPSPLSVTRPRLLDSACTALPYLYGSQRRGHPNLARGLGVHNLNESAGGFAGLATLLWLAPAGWMRRREQRRAAFLGAMVAIGALGAFEIPPVVNLLRVVPVINVIDHRRLTLWVAFGLVLLGALGLDRLDRDVWPSQRWRTGWIAAAVALLVLAAVVVTAGEPLLRPRIMAHYARVAASTAGASLDVSHARAERQVRQALAFVPWYAALSAAHLLALASAASAWRRGAIGPIAVRAVLCGLVLTDLFAFGRGLNPAIPRSDDRPVSALIAYLRREAPPPARVLALGGVLPPNTLMRYGLADVRNYDSVESARTLAYLDGLFEPGRARTSRREVTWDGVRRSLDRLRQLGVAAVAGPTPPPEGLFDRVDRVGAVWVGRLFHQDRFAFRKDRNQIRVDVHDGNQANLVISESFDPGWTATVDGRPATVSSAEGALIAVAVPPGIRTVVLDYRPPEVAIASMITGAAVVVAVLAISGVFRRKGTRKTAFGSWMPRRRRVRIDFMIATRSTSPASTEG
jgi:hypothetical protein